LRLWPVTTPSERRGKVRLDAGRVLTWLPYCGLFTSLFITPSSDDLIGLLRFFGLVFLVAALVIAMGRLLQRRGASICRGPYTRGGAPYAVLGLVIVGGTALF